VLDKVIKLSNIAMGLPVYLSVCPLEWAVLKIKNKLPIFSKLSVQVARVSGSILI